MPQFRATNKDTDEVVNYDAATPIPAHLSAPWRLEELIAIVPGPNDEPPADTRRYGGRRVLTKLEFLELFTPAERIAIRAARGQSPALDDYLYLLELAQEVNLDSPNTQGGVTMLEQAGILAVGRAEVILNG